MSDQHRPPRGRHVHGEDHDHGRDEGAAHHHHHDHDHEPHHHEQGQRPAAGGGSKQLIPLENMAPGEKVLSVRALSGLAGDIMLCGLAVAGGFSPTDLEDMLAELKLPALKGCLRIEKKMYNEIGGWHCQVTLPPEHAHRTFADIAAIIHESDMPSRAQAYASAAFRLLAEAEGEVHGQPFDQVTFHEVGALDSILDMCLVCSLFVRLAPDHFTCSPLPMADGGIRCAHGVIPCPAPAVLKLLDGVPVREFAGSGETVTPTAAALLKALGAKFGAWPRMVIEKNALVYGNKFFPDAPNGSIWSLGRTY